MVYVYFKLLNVGSGCNTIEAKLIYWQSVTLCMNSVRWKPCSQFQHGRMCVFLSVRAYLSSAQSAHVYVQAHTFVIGLETWLELTI